MLLQTCSRILLPIFSSFTTLFPVNSFFEKIKFMLQTGTSFVLSWLLNKVADRDPLFAEPISKWCCRQVIWAQLEPSLQIWNYSGLTNGHTFPHIEVGAHLKMIFLTLTILLWSFTVCTSYFLKVIIHKNKFNNRWNLTFWFCRNNLCRY